MARPLFQEWSFTDQCGVGVNFGRRSVCVGGGRGRVSGDLGSFTAPGSANFSNLQTVWAQAQGSETKDPALHDSRASHTGHTSHPGH